MNTLYYGDNLKVLREHIAAAHQPVSHERLTERCSPQTHCLERKVSAAQKGVSQRASNYPPQGFLWFV